MGFSVLSLPKRFRLCPTLIVRQFDLSFFFLLFVNALFAFKKLSLVSTLGLSILVYLD